MCTRVLALLALQISVALCFSWDLVVGQRKQLEFYENGTLTHTQDIPSAKSITSVTYDPVHYRVLFADNNNQNHQNVLISSFDLITRKIQVLVKAYSNEYAVRVVYDPVTQLLVWTNMSSIYSFSINPASSSYKADDLNILVKVNNLCADIAVDSCGGHIYWITRYEIERARFNGSEREVLIESTVDQRRSLAIDQQAQTMYWIETIYNNSYHQDSIVCADLNGKNRRTFYVLKNEKTPDSLAVSKDFIYWRGYDQITIGQLPKNQEQHEEAKVFPISSNHEWSLQLIAANYTITEQTEGNQNCEPLKRLIRSSTDTKFTNVSMLCVHGTKVSGESRCECTQGYTGERSKIKTCQNYCFQGNCSVSAEGEPKCRCHAGYSGVRCEVNACHKHCLNNGICFLNDEDEPDCECSADYEGERCEFDTTHTDDHTDNTKQHILRDLRREMREVIKEELQPTLRCFSDKIDEYEVKT